MIVVRQPPPNFFAVIPAMIVLKKPFMAFLFKWLDRNKNIEQKTARAYITLF